MIGRPGAAHAFAEAPNDSLRNSSALSRSCHRYVVHIESSQRQGVLVYNVEISNLNPPGIGAAFICSDNKGVCRSAIPIQVVDVRYNLDVIAFFEPRNAYFSFRIGDGYLSAEGQGYFLMSIGNSGIQKRSVPLHGPLPAMQNDNRSLAKPPVLRIPSDIIATLEITVRPISPKP